MPDGFTDITNVLVQEIFNLRETLDFYEIQLFKPETHKVFSPLVCGRSQCGQRAV